MKYATIVLMVLLAVAAGCATTPKTSFYLVPDPEGHVGEVTVTNQAASVTLNQANQTVAAERQDKAFSETRLAANEEIQAKFSDALAIVPPPPTGFSIYFATGSSKVDADSCRCLSRSWRRRGNAIRTTSASTGIPIVPARRT